MSSPVMRVSQFMDEDDETISAILSLLLWSSFFLALYIAVIGNIGINLYLFVALIIAAAIAIVVISEIRGR